jgi:hypothetical protein
MANKSASKSVFTNGYASAAREHLFSGKRLTRLEALVLFGLSDLTKLVSEMREEKFIVKSGRVSYATTLVRLNEYAVVAPPPNLPIREIMFTEYWMTK